MSVISSSSEFGRPINRLGILENMAKTDHATSQKCMNLFEDTELYLRRIKVPKVSDISFIADGVPFHARNTPKGQVADLHIWAVLGYLPFSVTSHKNRLSLITVMESTHELKTVKFGIDNEMRIAVSGIFEIPNPPSPNYIFEPLVHFLQEARPFMSLIGEYL